MGLLHGGLLAAGALCAGAAAAGSGGEAIHADGFEDPGCVPLYADGFLFEWSQVLQREWPGYNQVARFYPLVDTYISMRFTAGAPGQYGELLGLPVQPSWRSAGLLSISRTPGCFDPAFTGARCVSEPAPTLSLSWTTGNLPLRCELLPGESYYVNLTLGGIDPPAPYCDRNTELCMIELSQSQN